MTFRLFCRIVFFMKTLRLILCVGIVCFLVFSPSVLIIGAQDSFVDARFVRKPQAFQGQIVLYHIVRQKPYSGSLTEWLKNRAAEYGKKHKGVHIEIEGMDEQTFYERLENGRTADAYSFFSGTMYPDRLRLIPDLKYAYRSGLFQSDYAVPYCYSGYCKLVKRQDGTGGKAYYANDLLAARNEAGENEASEEKADVLYLDLRRAGDLIRYKDGFALSTIEPIDSFSDAVCWIGIDRNTDERRAEILTDFVSYLLSEEAQITLNALGLFAVSENVKNVPPDSSLKKVFMVYQSVQTVDPFLWQAGYDSLLSDAKLARSGDREALERFRNRLRELLR